MDLKNWPMCDSHQRKGCLAEGEAGLERLADKPVLFLWGTKDFAFQKQELERFKSHFPHHAHHPLEASHFWQDDQGEDHLQFAYII